MPFSGSVENEDDLMARVMLDPLSVIGQQYAQPQQGAAGGLPQTMAQYQPMQRPLQARAQPRSPQASRTDEQLGLALMLSGDDKLSGVGQTLFPKTLGADDGYKEQMADIRHQETMQQRYAQMNQPKSALVNVNTGDGAAGWEPLGTSGQFYRADSQGVPQVFAAPGSNAWADQEGDRAKREQNIAAKGKRAGEVAPGVMRDIDRAMGLADSAGRMTGSLAEYGSGEPTSFTDMLARGGTRVASGDAFELQQHLQSVKSNISIDALQQMRDMSPTGGALGQVPVQQQRFLMEVQGSLSASLPPDVLRENLGYVRNNYLQYMANAIYGEDWELDVAQRRGEITPSQAAQARYEREQMLAEGRPDLSYDALGRPQEPGPLDVRPRVSAPPQQQHGRMPQQGGPAQQGGGSQPLDVNVYGGPPPGIDPGTWQYLSEEERALWR